MQGRNRWLRIAACATVALAAAGLAATANAKDKKHHKDPVTTVSVTAVVNLPNSQKISTFDISYVDPSVGIYLLSDRTNSAVDVVDTASNQVINQLQNPGAPFQGFTGNNNTSGPDGVLITKDQVWAGDGNSTIKMFDEFTGGVVGVLNTNGTMRADEACFDPKDNLVMWANDADTPPFVSIIDASVFPPVIKKQIPMSGANGSPNATNGIEQCQYIASTGNFLVNIPEVSGPGNDTAPGAVVEISPTTMAITNVFSVPLGQCAGPQGMAVGETDVMLGCNASYGTVAIDPKTGAVVAAINDEGGADEIYFNSGDDTFFFGISSPLYSGLQRLGIVDDKTFNPGVSYATGIKSGLGGITRGSNHSVAADSGTNQIYVPIASNSGSDICSSHGGIDANGCIAVFKSP